MNTRFNARTTFVGACLLGVLPCPSLYALLVDSFTEGPFYANTPISSPLGTSRRVILGPRTTPSVDTLQVTADESQGSFTFYSHDTTPAAPWQNLYIQIVYFNPDTFDASPYGEFSFDFADLVGTGELVIEIGRGPLVRNANTLSTAIIEPGWLVVPTALMNYNSPDDSLSAFYSIRFTFQATSPTFGFTLNEIALTTVPEPASTAVLLGACTLTAAAFHRRRRAQPANRLSIGNFHSLPSYTNYL